MAARLAYLLLPLLARLVGASPALGIAPLYIPNVAPDSLIENRYTIVLKDETPSEAFRAHVNFVDVASQTRPLWGENGLIHVWDGTGILMGYSGHFSQDVLNMIRLRPEVKYVEQSQVMTLTETQSDSTWGLHRISHQPKVEYYPFEYTYEEGDEAGKGVTVYIIDSGIRLTHEEFEGRASWGITTVPGSPDDDDHGHGTHVGGTVAGKTYGVAKHANLIAVKVSDAAGHGTSDDALAGVEWADKDATERALHAAEEIRATGFSSHKGSVLNMSFSGGKSQSLTDGVRKAIEHGHHIAVGAGNKNTDACQFTPGDIAEVITVAASTIEDTRWDKSNFGNCVDIFAPGAKIKSASIASDTATLTTSGTSMAAPHVSGVLAYLISIYPHATFDPKVSSQSTLLEAYSAAYSALPAFVSCMLPKPESFLTIEKVTVAKALTPAQLKQAVLDLATWGSIEDAKSSNNALLFNNATSASVRSWAGKNFWTEM